MQSHSILLKITMGAIYPFIIVFGIYIIYNGHLSPGGGFQGGAILSSVFIVQYFTTYEKTIRLQLFNRVEKILYLALVIFVMVYVFNIKHWFPADFRPYYLLLMNALIGVKVTCGLSVVFYRFVLFESR